MGAMSLPLSALATMLLSAPTDANATPANTASNAGTDGVIGGITRPANVPPTFMAVSKTLTGHPELDDGLALLAWNALVSREQDFAARFARLASAINRPGGRSDTAATTTSFSLASVSNDPTLKATAMAIVSAWYLGRVGKVNPNAEDGPAFITYTGALMWRPTLDATLIPTYSRGGPGHWATPPVTG